MENEENKTELDVLHDIDSLIDKTLSKHFRNEEEAFEYAHTNLRGVCIFLQNLMIAKKQDRGIENLHPCMKYFYSSAKESNYLETLLALLALSNICKRYIQSGKADLSEFDNVFTLLIQIDKRRQQY